MLYMLRAGIADKVEAFVKAGGTFVASYMTGYVDDTDLCFLGGFPGPLKETLGIWCEEIDALYPDERNALTYQGKRYEVRDLCEIVHLRGAESLGSYEEDFYAGMPAVTVNHYGAGKAYFIAARTEQAFLDDFYRAIEAESALTPVLDCELPEGCSATRRTDGETDTIFVMNFSPIGRMLDIGEGGTDLETGKELSGIIELPARGVRIFARKK